MKKKVKEEWKKLQSNFKKLWNDFKKNPKKTTLTIINTIMEIIKNNTLFFVFVITSVFISTLLRFFTIHTIENLFLLKPVIGDLSIVLFLGSISFFVKQKNRFPYLLIVSIILSILCIINSIYYTFYTSFVSVSLISTSRYAVQVGDAIVENVMKAQDFIYLIAPILLIITYVRLRKSKKIDKKLREKRDINKMITCLAVAGFTLFIFLISLTPLEIGRYAKQWNREYIVMRFGVYAYQLNDIVKSIEPQLSSLIGYDNALKTFNEYYEETPDEQTYVNSYTGIFEGKNIIGIHAESMQTFLIGLKFNGKEVTPNLNKLASSSLYFNNFYSQVSNGTSSDTELSLNTSLMPTKSSTAFVSYFNREYVSIPSLLREKGYFAFSMHGNNGSYWNRNIMHESLGYQRFFSKSDYNIDEIVGLGLSDKSFFNQSVKKIKEINDKGQPYYGTVIMLSNHTPFSDVDKYGEFDVDIKEEVYNKETKEYETISYPYMEGTKLGNYLKSAHYADEAIGEFLQSLEDEGIMENTVIVLYGDHDARLPKTDFRKLYNYDKENDSILSSEDPEYKDINGYQHELLRKVPLMIYSKETKNKLHTEVSNVMGMYDIMPTLGNMFGFYNKYQLGTDIFNITDDNIVVYPNGNWVTNKVYYNAQNSEYFALKETIITEEYIQECNTYAEKLLSVSNATIVFDLIKKDRETKESKSDYIEEKVIE